MPDDKLIAFGIDDAFFIRCSFVQSPYCSGFGNRWPKGRGNDLVYDKTKCFETYPFPNATDSQKTHIRTIAENLDAHRKR